MPTDSLFKNRNVGLWQHFSQNKFQVKQGFKSASYGCHKLAFFSIDKNNKGKFTAKFLVATAFISNLRLLNITQSCKKYVAEQM